MILKVIFPTKLDIDLSVHGAEVHDWEPEIMLLPSSAAQKEADFLLYQTNDIDRATSVSGKACQKRADINHQ
jgi:hypothetical protein